ncbi:DUF4381 domain-containing protein [Endozoicomonas gorgoniicola]|uniref:DUF4381 domain-containing protein n=1 Tax=Endozoicomonas gorgoniicola TaxID=1234144 RepID=A0ABT3MWK3_9GAMM|nr:DUF4381 domain-containing protein [Endozoicomonas gorgoniicola]MCW7553438.1 DUF4381 domain-containing protein [Endozoicomonas gorgoniicola]
MEMPNPLDQLRPNQLPDPVNWWPPAIGWWLGGLLVVLVIAAVVYLTLKAVRKSRYRRQAARVSHQLLAEFQQHGDERRFTNACNRLLKQTALQAYPDEPVARLHGKEWQQFLADKSGNKGFIQGAGAALGDSRYQKEQFSEENAVEVNALHSITLSWIKKHHA